MGVRIQELPETTGINKDDLLIVEDGQGTKKGTVQQLDESLGVSQLNKEDVNFETKEVVLFGKGNKHRTSYINARAEIALKNYLNSRNDDNKALFVSDRKPHKRLSKFGIEKRIGQLGELAGIERRTFPHLIRHTTATDGLNRGMGVEEVQAILGHENIATTMIYAKISKNNVKLHHTKCIV